MVDSVIDITASRSQSDLKRYRVITLPTSGLEVLIISSLELMQSRHKSDASGNSVSTSASPAPVKAAAAMSVQVGSYADPVEAGKKEKFFDY